jgi:hypothetical protein
MKTIVILTFIFLSLFGISYPSDYLNKKKDFYPFLEKNRQYQLFFPESYLTELNNVFKCSSHSLKTKFSKLSEEEFFDIYRISKFKSMPIIYGTSNFNFNKEMLFFKEFNNDSLFLLNELENEKNSSFNSILNYFIPVFHWNSINFNKKRGDLFFMLDKIKLREDIRLNSIKIRSIYFSIVLSKYEKLLQKDLVKIIKEEYSILKREFDVGYLTLEQKNFSRINYEQEILNYSHLKKKISYQNWFLRKLTGWKKPIANNFFDIFERIKEIDIYNISNSLISKLKLEKIPLSNEVFFKKIELEKEKLLLADQKIKNFPMINLVGQLSLDQKYIDNEKDINHQYLEKEDYNKNNDDGNNLKDNKNEFGQQINYLTSQLGFQFDWNFFNGFQYKYSSLSIEKKIKKLTFELKELERDNRVDVEDIFYECEILKRELALKQDQLILENQKLSHKKLEGLEKKLSLYDFKKSRYKYNENIFRILELKTSLIIKICNLFSIYGK